MDRFYNEFVPTSIGVLALMGLGLFFAAAFGEIGRYCGAILLIGGVSMAVYMLLGY